MDSIDWDDVRYFLALARERSLSATARVLGVEHSTVARRIARFEKAFGVKLFNRMARGWVLTAEGQELSKRAARLEEDILSLKRVALNNPAHAGIVRISAPPAVLSCLVAPTLKALTTQYPEIILDMIGETRGADLTRGEADIALRMSDPVGDELVSSVVCSIEYALFGRKQWIGIPKSKCLFIGFRKENNFWQSDRMDEIVGDQGYIIRSNCPFTIRSTAAAGYGIAFLPRFLGEEDDQLVEIPIPNSPQSCPLHLVMQRDVRQAPRVRAVADYLAVALSRH